MRHKILVVDDEQDILKLLEYNLGNAGFTVVTAGDGPEGFDAAKRIRPDLVILDIMLPNMDGTEVLKMLKHDPSTMSIPVIMLTAKGEELDRIIGLELGADDYIVKPFSPKEVLLRVNAVLRKNLNVSGQAIISSGPISIDPVRFNAFAGGEELHLTATEFKLLAELVKYPGRPIGRETLVKRISNADNHTTFRTVDTHIQRLRAKLGRYSGRIETVRSIGYRFREAG